MTAAIYCRLSKEDEDRRQESESIQNQKSMLASYALEQGWNIYQIYSDEDYSGADQARPAFRQLISDAETGKFQIVLVKTQSRFTRDIELVERYIHGLFPLWGVRFVAVVEGIDTNMKGNKKARQISGLINEWYLEDLSENIRTVFDHKRRAGQYIGSFPIYGYLKDPLNKNRLVIDPQAANVVRQIYRLYLSGNGTQHIAHLLNQEGVPNPSRYKQLQGYAYHNAQQTNELGLWNRTTVGRILRQEMYIGDLVQGRRRKVSYKSKKLLELPKEEWIIVSGTHEAIVDRETFAAVQRLLGQRTKSSGTGEVHLLSGKVKCMDCGSTMVKVSATHRSVRRSYLRCKLYATDKNRCSNHSIRLDLLEEQVLSLLKGHLEQYFDRNAAEKLISDSQTEQSRTAFLRESSNLSLELARRNKAMRDLYLDKSQGLLDDIQFRELNDGFFSEKKTLQQRLTYLNQKLQQLERRVQFPETTGGRIDQWLNTDPLPRELLAELVDKIEVGQRSSETGIQPLHISWMF